MIQFLKYHITTDLKVNSILINLFNRYCHSMCLIAIHFVPIHSLYDSLPQILIFVFYIFQTQLKLIIIGLIVLLLALSYIVIKSEKGIKQIKPQFLIAAFYVSKNNSTFTSSIWLILKQNGMKTNMKTILFLLLYWKTIYYLIYDCYSKSYHYKISD